MATFNMDTMENYEHMDGQSAVLYTYLFNLEFPTGDVEDLSERIACCGHTLRLVKMKGYHAIMEYDFHDECWAEWNCIEDYHM